MSLSPLPLEALMPLSRAADLVQLFERWVERGWLRALDKAFVGFLHELDPQADPLVLLAAALTSHQLGHGHVCLDLFETLKAPDFALSLPPEGDLQTGAMLLPSQLLAGLDGAHWCHALAASPLVALAVDGSEAAQSRPLVLSGKRLYLRRYWTYERRIDTALRLRLATAESLAADLPQRLNGLFDQAPPDGVIDWQKLACALATRGAFSIVTGGPGTGKTTTVVRLLALLQAPAVEAGSPLRIRLAAPTGKAAARLTESISQQVLSLNVPDNVREKIPTQVTTVHRLLGSRPGTRHFRHHLGNPLPLDVLVVDEASMIDLEMMANLLDALPPHARLVLLGDKDQLASVEAGAVLGDLCRDAAAGRYSTETRRYLQATTGQTLPDALLESGAQAPALAQHMVMLRKSRRFGGPIGALALAVNQGDAPQARRVLDADPQGAVHLLASSDPAAAVQLALRGRLGAVGCYRDYLRAMAVPVPAQEDAHTAWVQGVLRAFDGFRLLCAVREGPWGAAGLNRAVETALRGAGLLQGRGEWYAGRPVMVTRNDAGLGVFNGDIGIVLQAPGGGLRAYFADGPQLRSVGVARLAHVETAFAMTVHKSQGSEFGHTALVLPPQAAGALLSRELVYTGITRARDAFTLVAAQPAVLEQALRQRTQRSSGLPARLQA